MNFIYRILHRLIKGRIIEVVDTFNPPRSFWNYVSGIWKVGSLKQITDDVPSARSLNTYKPEVNVSFSVVAKPDLIDENPRFFGVCVREVAPLTHYFAGVYYTDKETIHRIYKQYTGLPKVEEGLVSYFADGAYTDHLADDVTQATVRGLSPRYKVNIVYYDDDNESYTVPENKTSVSFNVRKLIKKIEVYDASNNLVAVNEELSGGNDKFVLGGEGTYVLLAEDNMFVYDYNWIEIYLSVLSNIITSRVGNSVLVVVDSEFYGVSYHGLRCYNSPVSYRIYRRLR